MINSLYPSMRRLNERKRKAYTFFLSNLTTTSIIQSSEDIVIFFKVMLLFFFNIFTAYYYDLTEVMLTLTFGIRAVRKQYSL